MSLSPSSPFVFTAISTALFSLSHLIIAVGARAGVDRAASQAFGDDEKDATRNTLIPQAPALWPFL